MIKGGSGGLDSAYFNKIEGDLDSAYCLNSTEALFCSKKNIGTLFLVSKIGRKPEEGARRKLAPVSLSAK